MQAFKTPAETKAERDSKQESAFQEFLRNPQTKLALSLVPPNETAPEALHVLLSAAFAAGSAHGGGEIASSFLEAMLSGMEKRERGEGRF